MHKVPRSHKGFLIEPRPGEWGSIIERNRASSGFFRPWAVGCAHQSSLYHPGVLFREALVNACPFGRKVHVSCDTSPVPGRYIEIPAERERLKLEYYASAKNSCYAFVPPPSEKKIENFMCMSPTNETRQFFKNVLYSARRSDNAAVLNVTAKEFYLKNFGYKLKHVYLSFLLNTGMYRSFLRVIGRDKKKFIKIYNKSLDTLAYQTGIRELKKELPFTDIEGIPCPHPKALVLNLFLRLYVFDLYIQGVGESLYSPASDYIIKEFFGISPPAAVTASFTLYHGARDPEGLKDQTKREELKLRDMQYNPQKFTENKIPSGAVKKGASESLAGTEAKKKHREIKKKKDLIRKSIEPLIEKQKSEVRRLKEIMQITSREYPFFIYNSGDIEYLFEKAAEEMSECG